MPPPIDIIQQIFSLHFDLLNNMSLFSACKMTYTPNMITLESVDDAATANWSGGWRTPTKEEWQELYQNTTCIWNTLNDVYGRYFIASNGNVLFLPATGFRIEGSLNHTGSEGYYWSSSINMEYPYYAWRFYFNSDYCDIGCNVRDIGQPVRAVRSAPQN